MTFVIQMVAPNFQQVKKFGLENFWGAKEAIKILQYLRAPNMPGVVYIALISALSEYLCT